MIGTENKRIQKLYYRVELFKPVLQGGACQDQGICGGNAFNVPGGLGQEVLNALRFVQDDQVKWEEEIVGKII